MAHILLVDDDRDIVTLMKFLLERDGHTITEAFNGAEALEKLGVDMPQQPDAPPALPDLIVLDVMMPVLDGHSVSARLLKNDATRSIPLLVLTAKGGMRDLFDMSPNVAAYIEKPFDPKNLRELIAGMLAGKK